MLTNRFLKSEKWRSHNKSNVRFNGINYKFQENENTELSLNSIFLSACENGDIPTVEKILTEKADFNIDIVDNLGRSALRLAVESEHIEIVLMLLDRSDSPKIREALLLAIYLGHVQMAECILRHPKYKILTDRKFISDGQDDSFWSKSSNNDAQFSPDVTPLMLAATYNRTEIVQMLLLNGDRMTKPHDYHCKCNDCLNRITFDSLRSAQSRLNAYKALASESYISLASPDPILTSFELAHELRELSKQEKYFRSEYTHLANTLSSYVVKLLDKVRSQEELYSILSKTGRDDEEKYERLSRMDLAIKYHEKKFVAHPSCQQKLVEIWYSGIHRISKMNNFMNFLFICLYIFLLPFFCIVYIFAPKSKLSQIMRQPCVKFIGHTISYLMFIGMIVSSSLQSMSVQHEQFSLSKAWKNAYCNYQELFSYRARYDNFTVKCGNQSTEPHYVDGNAAYVCANVRHDFYLREFYSVPLDIAIALWVVGFLWQESKQVYNEGFMEYFGAWNNMVDTAMNILYVAAFALKYFTIIKVTESLNKLSHINNWRLHPGEDERAYIERIGKIVYWLDADRFNWSQWDPRNLAENMFAIANILSFTRIMFILPANQQLGPLQISLGKMVTDIVKFAVIFLLVFLAFLISLNNLYWYYNASIRKKVEINERNIVTNSQMKFGTIELTFRTVFWSIFGAVDPKFVSLDEYNNSVTTNIGLFVYGTFMISCDIVLLNMLIAMMSKSFESIQGDADVEWKFARSKLYMEYIKAGATLPVPMNIIPTPKSFVYFCKYICKLVQCKKLPPTISKRLSIISDDFLSVNNQKLNRTNAQRHPKNKMESSNGVAQIPVNMETHRAHLFKSNGFLEEGNASSANVTDKLSYKKVMDRIIKRYMLHKQREEQSTDFEELKQDIQSFRFQIMNEIDSVRETLTSTVNRKLSYITLNMKRMNEEISSSTPKKVSLTPNFAENVMVMMHQKNLSKSFESHSNEEIQDKEDEQMEGNLELDQIDLAESNK
ncbi:hypothetical protein SNEBB_008688, partial [Seison nebaliae]